MAEGGQSFIPGGLPSRELPQGKPATRFRLGKWLAVTGVAAALCVGVALAIPGLLASHEEVPVPAPEVTLSAQEQSAVDAGGAAVPGHIVSAELCDAVQAYTAVESEATAVTALPAEKVAALEQLSAVPSPYQGEYKAYLAMVKSPDSITSEEDVQLTAVRFADAIQIDVTTCA